MVTLTFFAVAMAIIGRSLVRIWKAAERKRRLVMAKTTESKARLAEVENLVLDQIDKEEKLVEEKEEEMILLGRKGMEESRNLKGMEDWR